ncbi:uncharacterized protein EAE97_000019 [Botrytis byssoidea]|uniref:Uncharacterized protein n=1 Tax=Botrytis byssoidea TaxID=139641 RepID=A0A9P5IWV5_9HELO|nr:uncharacterized protein EAE97_000019 [Botrytis byssoidea]KAF7954760.1 hypothetical protein EAE97_000019 [Botrytis byssoidea]
MTFVHVGKTPVPQRIVPKFSNEVFYPGSAPAGVTPQYFTTLNVYQQWLQIFGPGVPLPEDDRNMPGYPQKHLRTETGEEGPLYRYCSKERVWKPRSEFPISNGRFLSTCINCKTVDERRAAKRLGESLKNRNEGSFQGLQPNQDVIARSSQRSMPTNQQKSSVANLPLRPKAKVSTAKSIPKYPMPVPVFATPALGPPKKTTSRLEEFKGMQFEVERLRSSLIGHGRVKKLYEAKLEKFTMATDRVSEGSEDDRGKRMAEAARLQDLISKVDDKINKARSKLDVVNLMIDLMADMNKDDIGYLSNNEDTGFPSIDEERNIESLNSPENFDNAREAGVDFAGQTNDSLQFSPTPHSYPPLDEDGHILSKDDPSISDLDFVSGLEATAEKEPGDGTRDVDMNSELDSLASVSAIVPCADSSVLPQNRDSIDPNLQQFSNIQTENPQPQEGLEINRFRALSVSQDVQDQHAPSYKSQSRQSSSQQQFQFQPRPPSMFRDLNPHRPYQTSDQNSNHLQPYKATNTAAKPSPLTTQTPDLNSNLFKNSNPTIAFQFRQSDTVGKFGHYGVKIEEDVGEVQTLASHQTRETVQQAQQYQPNEPMKMSQLALKAKNVYEQTAQQARMDKESQEAHDGPIQEELPKPTRVVQQPKQACEEPAQDQLTEEQVAQNAKIFYERQASEKQAQQNETTREASVAHDQVIQEQLAKEQPVQQTELFQLAKLACDRLAQDQSAEKRRAERARDVYDQLAYEKRTGQVGTTYKITQGYDQMDEDEMDQDQLAEDQLAEDQLAQKATDAQDVYDQRACEIRDQRNVLVKHVHDAHDQHSQLSQKTQLALQDQQGIRTRKAEYQARIQRNPFGSLPKFHSLPNHELARPTQGIQSLKRRADETLEPRNQPQPEHSIRRSKRARRRAETEAEMQE